jgi:hypothetical protein
MLKKSLVALAALSLAVSPALAQDSAQSLSVAEASDSDGGLFQPGGAIVAQLVFVTIIILGVLTATGTIFDDGENSTSP